MGLDTSHGCWHGAYSAFMRWRTEIAKAAGLPPLGLMSGFYAPLKDYRDGGYSSPTFYISEGMDGMGKLLADQVRRFDADLPIEWECLKPNPLYLLLNHSDCEGTIPWKSCKGIADSLELLLPKLPEGDAGGHIGNWRDKTQQFIDGLRLAHKEKEDVDFH